MPRPNKKSYLNPKVVLRKTQIGQGLFVLQKIKKNEVVVDYENGPGRIIGPKESTHFFKQGFDYGIQVGDDKFFAAYDKTELEDVDFINHSCDPNCGLKGPLKIVAMRDIKPGEEITYDYAMSESAKYKMTCLCRSKNCRKIITGNDWKLPVLQKKYGEYFSEYLLKKI